MTRHIRRVGAIGDIHAEDASLGAVLEFLGDQDLDAILAVGDIVDGPGDVERCLELLREHDVYAVCGNHDRWALNDELRTLQDATQALSLAQRRYLESLPATMDIETPLGPLLLCHGLANNDMRGVTPNDFGYALEANDELQELLRQDRVRFVVNGHTHRRMVRRLGNLTIVNAGTLLRDHEPCFAVIDFEEDHVEFFDIRSAAIKPAERHFLFRGRRQQIVEDAT